MTTQTAMCNHQWIVGVPASSPPGTAPSRICLRCGVSDTHTLRLVSHDDGWVWVCPCDDPVCKRRRQRYYQQRFRRGH